MLDISSSLDYAFGRTRDLPSHLISKCKAIQMRKNLKNNFAKGCVQFKKKIVVAAEVILLNKFLQPRRVIYMEIFHD